MNVFREKLVLVEEVWFDEEPETKQNVDVLHYIQRPHPIKGIQFDEFHTILIDLTKSSDDLWKNLGKTNRYKIKRAEQKDLIEYFYWDTNNIDEHNLNNFLDFHDQFSVSQSLKKISRSRIRSLVDMEILDLSIVKSQDGTPLGWHAHCLIKNRVCFFSGASIKNHNDTAYQSMLGRANRYHHWQDILRFKNSGISIYDFGGWYAGNTDQKLLNINKFKEEFGGEVVKNFKSLHGVTLKGKLSVGLYKMLSR